MITTDYTRDFQIALLVNIANDDELIKVASQYLQVNDFDVTACQFIYEALISYYETLSKRPPVSSLITEVEGRITQPQKSKVQLLPEEYEALSIVLERVIHPTELDPPYYATKLMEFIRYVRGSRVMSQYAAQPNNLNVDSLIEQVNKLSGLTDNIGGFRISYSTTDIHAINSQADVRRISTGLPTLDARICGGLLEGGLGLISACPGVGKTTSLINFGNGASTEGWRTLFITLELTESRITHRYQAIAAGISASFFNKPMTEWTDEALALYSYIINPDYPFYNYFAVVDASTRACTVADVDTLIDRWITETRQQHGKDAADKCKIVCLDWLDQLSPGMKHKNMKSFELYPELLKELGKIARKYKIALWTACQGRASADSKEVLTKADVAWGYHRNDAIDTGIGVGVINEYTGNTTNNQTRDINDETEVIQDCSRKLNFSVNKNRDGNNSSVVLYQAPTLGLFASQEEWLSHLTVIKTGDKDRILAHRKKKK